MKRSNFICSYDAAGNTRGIPRFTTLKPMKLKWSISESVGLVFYLY